MKENLRGSVRAVLKVQKTFLGSSLTFQLQNSLGSITFLVVWQSTWDSKISQIRFFQYFRNITELMLLQSQKPLKKPRLFEVQIRNTSFCQMFLCHNSIGSLPRRVRIFFILLSPAHFAKPNWNLLFYWYFYMKIFSVLFCALKVTF